MKKPTKSISQIGAQLATNLLSVGDEPGSPAHRIQFMGGYLCAETNQGGMGETALFEFFCRELEECLPCGEKPMAKPLKSIAKSMKIMAKCQLRRHAMYADSLTHSQETLQINRENQRILMDSVELEQKPFALVLEGLLELIPADLGKQEVVNEAKRMIRLMKPAQEKQ